MRVFAGRLAGLLLFLTIPSGAILAQDGGLDDIFGAQIRKHAEGALSVLGISAVPSETASALLLDTGSNPDSEYDFAASQLGGGFQWSDEFPLYLEGYIGYSRYDPVLLFSEGGEKIKVPGKWTSAAATGGIGWNFNISEYVSIRPMLNLTLGRVQSDTSVVAQVIGDKLGLDPKFLKGGGITAGGYGGSLALVYNRRWENDYEVDVTLRHTHIRLVPIAGDKGIVADADAITTALWSRLRVPTGLRAFDRPVRTVAEFTASYLPGDQGKILHTDWLAGVGFGAEIDVSETWVPWVSTSRLVVRYTKGESLSGFSVGLAASF